MDRHPVRDFIVGLFVIAGLVALGYLSLSIAGLTFKSSGGLKLYASFHDATGIKERAPVMMGGVKVGEVTGVRLDKVNKDYHARVDMDLRPDLDIDSEASAAIYTDGLLGDRYIALQLGAGEKQLKTGDAISFTQDSVILEKLIGKLVTSMGSGGGEGGKTPTAPAPQ